MRHNHSVNPNDHQHQERRPPHNCPVCGETLALTRRGRFLGGGVTAEIVA